MFKRNACLSLAVAAIALGAAVAPASASSLMNVVSTGTTSVSGHIKSQQSSWDSYAGAQVVLTATGSVSGSTLGSLASEGGNLGLNYQETMFKGGDKSFQEIDGHITSVQTTLSTGITSSFGN